MTKLYMAMNEALAMIRQQHGEWVADLQLVGSQPQCVAVDPLHQEHIYCGTFDQGLWRSGDAGQSWRPVGEGVTQRTTMASSALPMPASVGKLFLFAGPRVRALDVLMHSLRCRSS